MTAYMPQAKAVDWRTPYELIDLVRRFAPVVLDPSADKDPVHHFARVNLDGSDGRDGLRTPWTGHGGLVYCNPPYGAALADWTRKAALEAKKGAELILLVPVRTDTRWWQENLVGAAAVCFWRGRLRFCGAPASAPFPSALVYFGPSADRFKYVFGVRGWVVRP